MSIESIVARQREYFRSGATLPVNRRQEALKSLRSSILKYKEQLFEALKSDLGKSEAEAYMCEVGLTLSELTYVLKHTAKWCRNSRVKTSLTNFHAKSFVVKQPYGGQSSVIPTTKGATARVIRKSQGSNIEIIFSNLSELKSKGLIQSNLSLSPQFDYNRDGDGDEFASAEINNSFAAMTSGKEYISLFQITKQKGNVISFLINNLPGVGEYYYLIVLDSRKPQ